jgi:DNA-binding MarR family transcriptional regulator
MASSIDYGLVSNGAVLPLTRPVENGGDRVARGVNDTVRITSPTTPAAKAALLYKARRRRAEHFSIVNDLFGEPVWDVLLDLFVAHERGQKVSVSSASSAACVPTTTALRTIAKLIQRGLVADQPDQQDKRRRYVRLTDRAVTAMHAYLQERDGVEFQLGQDR